MNDEFEEEVTIIYRSRRKNNLSITTKFRFKRFERDIALSNVILQLSVKYPIAEVKKVLTNSCDPV